MRAGPTPATMLRAMQASVSVTLATLRSGVTQCKDALELVFLLFGLLSPVLSKKGVAT
jgi:hypothetical protein